MSKYLLTLPEIPAGQDFARDSFWWAYRERFAIPIKFRWKVKPTAYEWFTREENRARLHGQPFPPKPIFRKAPPKPIFRKAPPKMPQPNTGKDGANGWTPRNS